MRGSVFRRGKSWKVVLDMGVQPAQRCTACGRLGLYWLGHERLAACPRCGGELYETRERRQQFQPGRFRTRREAQELLDELVPQMRAGFYVAPSSGTVAEFLSEWLTATKVSLRASTWTSYRMNIERHVLSRLGSIPLQQLSVASVNALYAELLSTGRSDGKGALSPRTVRYIHTILRKALSDGVRWSRLQRNVADLANPPAVRTTRAPEQRTWTAEQLRNFLDHVREDRLYAAWCLAATTGMRRGEVLGLRWQDVDLDLGRASVRQSLIAVRHELIFSEPKTNRGRRSIALDAVTVAALRGHRKRQLEERMQWGPAWQDTGLVFTREDGSAMHPDTFSKDFDRHVRAAGLPDIRLHDLRHTHATLALAAGVHPKVVSERIGHSTVSLTLDVYSHAIPAMEQEAAERVAGLIFR